MHTTASAHCRRPWARLGHLVRPVAVAAIALAIAAAGTNSRAMVTLTAGDVVNVGQGISVTLAPGWAVGRQGPGWVTLHNALGTAEMEIKLKPANGIDATAVLQGDIGQLNSLSTTGLTNVGNLGSPTAGPVQSGHFQQEASMDYTADGTSRMGLIPVVGSFSELLNTSTGQSAFVVFAQNGDAPNNVDGEGQMMIDSILNG